MLLVTGGDDQAIHVAALRLEWPRDGRSVRLSSQATLRLPSAHGSAVRARSSGRRPSICSLVSFANHHNVPLFNWRRSLL